MRRVLKQLSIFFIFSLFSLEFFSCGSTKLTTPEYLNNLDDENYKVCEKYLTAKVESKSNDNRIRDNFDLAMIKHFQKDYDSSLKILNQTDRLMEDSVTKSITKGLAGVFVNDNATEYAANPYEYVYINVFNALNYYKKGNVEEAAVEIRRLNEKQRKYLNKYGEWVKNDQPKIEISDTYKLLKLDPAKVTDSAPAEASPADIFRDSATGRYLSIVFGMMDDSVNNSWNVSADAATLQALNPSFDVAGECSISDGKGRLDVLAFCGLIGRRGEKRVIIGPFPGIQFPVGKTWVFVPPFDFEFVYPAFPAPQKMLEGMVVPTIGWGPSFTVNPGKNEIIPLPKNQITGIKVVVSGEKLASPKELKLNLLEDFNYALQQDVNTKARKAYSRSVKRSLVKKLAGVAGATTGMIVVQQAIEKDETFLTVAAYAAAYLSSARIIDQIDKTETADIRQVYALPAQSYASGLELAPGNYNVHIQYLSNNGNVINEEKFQDIQVKSGKTILVESLCRK